jgi:FkbM family methyltransferase
VLKNFLKAAKRLLQPEASSFELYKKISFSQSGEDLLVKFIFDSLGIKNPSYLDIGAYHPFKFNNTALFYMNGSRGINIEPDPDLFTEFIRFRREDINLNLGVAEREGHEDFYIISAPTLNTFSAETAHTYQHEGDYTIKEVKKIKTMKINNIVQQYANNKFPDFLNVDAEGIDELVVQAIDYERNSPAVICLETITFSTNGKGIKQSHLISFLQDKGYLLYADTYINSIFVKKDLWER